MSYNRAYHRYFEGYVEQEICDPATGRRKIRRVYAGPYYRHNLTDRAWVKLKAGYLLLTVWATACLLMQGLSGSSHVWYLAVPLSLGAIAIAWLIFLVVSYALHGRELEIRQFRDRESLKAAAMAGAILFLALLAGQAAWMIVYRNRYSYGALCAVLDASAAAGLFFLYRTERDMPYVKRENSSKPSPDAYDIRYKEE